MTFLEFKTKFAQSRIIDIRNVKTFFNGIDRRRLYEWQKKGYLIRIANNHYIFQDTRVDDHGLKTIASRVYQPAYIGLQSALAYYGFIPEAVFQTISITTRRSKIIKTAVGDFQYRAIKKELFFGYNAVDDSLDHFFISDPEKTILDFLYFLPEAGKKEVLEELRFNPGEVRAQIDAVKLRDYALLFDSQKINTAVKSLMEIVDVKF